MLKLAGSWKGAKEQYERLGYLKSLHNRERFRATNRFVKHILVKQWHQKWRSNRFLFHGIAVIFTVLTWSIGFWFGFYVGILYHKRMSNNRLAGKLRCQWKIPMFKRKYIFKGLFFHCHVSFQGSNFIIFARKKCVISCFVFPWVGFECPNMEPSKKATIYLDTGDILCHLTHLCLELCVYLFFFDSRLSANMWDGPSLPPTKKDTHSAVEAELPPKNGRHLVIDKFKTLKTPS